jgi:signal transduction histidine kinase
VVALGGALLGMPPDSAGLLGGVLAVISGAAMAMARRRPLTVVAVQALFVVVTGRASPSASAAVVVLLLLSLGVLAYTRKWLATAAGATVTYAALVLNLFGTTSWQLYYPNALVQLIQLVSLAGLTAMPVAFGRYLYGVRGARQVAEERAVEAETHRIVETRAVRLAERTRLARDLHDIVAHHVGAMTLRASSGKVALDAGGDTAIASEALSDVAATGRHVLDELRALLAVLRDPDAVDTVDAEALVTDPEATIVDAVERVRAAGVPVTVDLDPRLGDASLLVRATTARVAQEALTNVLKHAGAGTPAQLGVHVTETGSVLLAVRNDEPAGPAPRPAVLPSSRLGLAGMRERVALLGGRLVAAPRVAGGWEVKMELPAKGAR